MGFFPVLGSVCCESFCTKTKHKKIILKNHFVSPLELHLLRTDGLFQIWFSIFVISINPHCLFQSGEWIWGVPDIQKARSQLPFYTSAAADIFNY